eukprot:bmy_02756T0
MAHFWEWLDACRGPVSCALVALMAHGGPQGQLLGADRAQGRWRGTHTLPWLWHWLRAPPATPSPTDVLHIYADMLAFRDEKGSDFIQTLVEVLRADPRGDLLELMTE